MGSLLRRPREIAEILRGHGLSGLAALVIADGLYKFHSFALEGLAFLATWYVLDVVVHEVRGLIDRRVRSARA